MPSKKGSILNFLQNTSQTTKKEIFFKNDPKECKIEPYFSFLLVEDKSKR
jgi:hypothetical protein